MVPRLASPKPFTPRTAGVLSGSRVPGQPRTQRGAVSLRNGCRVPGMPRGKR